jgi:hypothetical protein
MIRQLWLARIALMAGVVFSTSNAQAVLLVYEPFNYPEGNFLAATTVGAANTTTSPVGYLAPSFNNWYGTGIDAGGYQTANDGQIIATDLAVPGLAKPSATKSLTLGGMGHTMRVSLNSSTAAIPNRIASNLTDSPDALAGTDSTLQATDTGGTGYYSIALRVLSTTALNANGGVLMGFNNVIGAQVNNPSTAGAGLTIRPKAGGGANEFQLGIIKQGTTNFTNATWSPDTFTTDSTIFVVGKYQTVGPLETGAPFTTDDIASLWINPAPSTFGLFEPAGALTNTQGDDITTNGVTNNHTLQSFILRQTGTTANNQVPIAVVYDELRVGTNWADVTPGVPADYNGDGAVDAADYVLWRKGGPLRNEVDMPGTINATDYTAWRSRFSNSSGAGAGLAGGSSVPEPSCVLLFLVCALQCTTRRHSRSKP